MFHRPEKIPPLRKIHGGKYYLCRRIISLIEPRAKFGMFVDCTAGGGSVLLNVDTSQYKKVTFIASDYDRELASAHAGVKKIGGKVAWELQEKKYDYTEENWLNAVSRARAGVSPSNPGSIASYLMAYRGSRGGMGKEFAWSDRLRGGRPGDLNAWENFRNEHIKIITKCYRDFIIMNRCIIDIISAYDAYDTVFYIDLPYPKESRTAKNIYNYEMLTYRSDIEIVKGLGVIPQTVTHEDVLELVLKSKGKFYISSYHNELYDNLLGNFHAVEFDMPNHSSQADFKQRRTEVLWMSPK